MSGPAVKVPRFKPVGVGRNWSELQPLLRQVADASGKSRAQIDADGGLPDSYSSKALAPVPVGTTDNPSAKMIAKLLRGIGAVLVVAKATDALVQEADLGVKRREDRVHARLLDGKVYAAAKTKLARENGKKGGKARFAKMTKDEIATHQQTAAAVRWWKRRRARLAARAADTSRATTAPAREPSRCPPQSSGSAAPKGRARGPSLSTPA